MIHTLVSDANKLFTAYILHTKKSQHNSTSQKNDIPLEIIESYKTIVHKISLLDIKTKTKIIKDISGQIQIRGSAEFGVYLTEINSLFSNSLPYAELGDDFTKSVLGELDAVKQHTDINLLKTNLIFNTDELKTQLSPFIKTMKYEARLEFIGYIDALVASGSFQNIDPDFFNSSKEGKLNTIILMINKSNAYDENLVKFENGHIQMAIGAPNTIDVLILGADGKLHGRDVTMTTGSDLEGNQFARHKVIFEHINQTFGKTASTRIEALRQITHDTTNQLNNGNHTAYQAFLNRANKDDFFNTSSKNYHVLQQSSGGTPEEIEFKNVITYYAYYSNLKRTQIGTSRVLSEHSEIKSLMNSIKFEFVGNKHGKNFLGDASSNTMIKKNLSDLIQFSRTGEPSFIRNILNSDKGAYISILKSIKYSLSAKIDGNKTNPIVNTLSEFLKFVNSDVLRTNSSDTRIQELINDIEDLLDVKNNKNSSPAMK